jgi:hypothetical protein
MGLRDTILSRADHLLAVASNAGENAAQINEAYQGALTLLRAAHGPKSIQEDQLLQAMARADKCQGVRLFCLHSFVTPAVIGALNSLKGDIAAGLTGSVAMQASGAVLGDLLGLAKEALAASGGVQKNVAAVLVAAAFEDTLRRLAEIKAGLVDRPKLEEVIGILKNAQVLVGASASTANGYLKFRNDSLHADWSNVETPVIGGCLTFVEGLLNQHFS